MKTLSVSNALAYFGPSLVAKKKSFVTLIGSVQQMVTELMLAISQSLQTNFINLIFLQTDVWVF